MTARDGGTGAFDGLADSVAAVSFDLFGTLVTVDRSRAPDEAVAAALRERDVAVPDDWAERYRTAHIEVEPLQELPLHEHVLAALRSADRHEGSFDEATTDDARFDEATTDEATIEDATTDEASIDEAAVADAVRAAFDTPVETREGAVEAVTGLAEQVPVGVLSNSSVTGLVERTLERSAIPEETFETVCSSVAIGWRKPHERAFERVASDLGASTDSLLHVGDDPRTDGAATRTGAGAVLVPESGPLELASRLEDAGWLR